MSGRGDVANVDSAGRNVLAIDIGSSSVRAGVADATGKLFSTERRAPAMREQGDAGDLAVEFDPEQMWKLVIETARAAVSGLAIDSESIAGVAVTSQRQGIALLDRDGKTLYAGPNIDMRAVFQGAAIDEEHADLVWRTTGHLPSHLAAWARIRWFQEERPALFDRISAVVTLSDWIAFRLTGELSVNHAAGVEAGLIELQTGEPASDIAEALGLSRVSVPRPAAPLAPSGSLRADVAEALGLGSDIPVFNAGPDTQTGLYGMGVTAPGATGIVAGWSCAVQRVTDCPLLDPERGLWAGRHVEPGRWILESNLGIMGGAYSWLCGLISPGHDSGEAMNRLNRDVLDAPAGGSGLTAHLGPALTNMSSAELRAGGLVFPVPLALQAPTPGEIARAALEGFGFAIKSGIERIDELSGTPSTSLATSLALGGGMIRSSAFAELLASILGREIEVWGADATLSGAAMLAGRALEGGAGPNAAVTIRVSPDRALSSDYEYLYEEWLQRTRALGEMPV